MHVLERHLNRERRSYHGSVPLFSSPLPPSLSPSLPSSHSPPLRPSLPHSLPSSLSSSLLSSSPLLLSSPSSPLSSLASLTSLLSLSQASLLSVPIFGRIDIFPRHTIILDRTNCPNASVSLPPTVAPVTPTETTPTPPSNASDTCLALYEIVQRNTTEPFVCRLREDCDGFWCRLDIVDTHYNITIQVSPNQMNILFPRSLCALGVSD